MILTHGEGEELEVNSQEDLNTLKINQLKEILTEKGLDAKGQKAALVEKLWTSMQSAAKGTGKEETKENTKEEGKTKSTHVAALIKEIPEGMEAIVEGDCTVCFKKGEVFYNKVQVLNRDLSILYIQLFGELRRKEEEELYALKPERVKNIRLARSEYDEKIGFMKHTASVEEWHNKRDGLRILEALSASGLRSIRYAQEIEGIKYIHCNDIEEAAVESIRRNVEFNNIDTKTHVIPSHADATLLMYQHRSPQNAMYDVVDLDPYGSASIFLDGAVQCIADGGLLIVTCTDMAVLCGNSPEVCFSKYGATVGKTAYCHEFGLRIVLASIQSAAARYGRYIVPLSTFSIDFYCRMFVRVYESKAEVKKIATKLSYVISCLGCGSYHLQPVGRLVAEGKRAMAALGPNVGSECDQCNSHHAIHGPIWSDPIIDEDFLKSAILRVADTDEEDIPTHKRLLALLTVLAEEVHEAPLYYSLPAMCNLIHCTVPRIKLFQAALVNAGYKVSQSHCDPNAIKTNAPHNVMWDIIRAWVEKHPLTSTRRKSDGSSVGERILNMETKLEVNWEIPGFLFSKRPEVVRYPQNPEKYWGPKARANGKRKNSETNAEEKMEGEDEEEEVQGGYIRKKIKI